MTDDEIKEIEEFINDRSEFYPKDESDKKVLQYCNSLIAALKTERRNAHKQAIKLQAERKALKNLAGCLDDGAECEICPNVSGLSPVWCDWKGRDKMSVDEQLDLDPYEEGLCTGVNIKCWVKWAREN